MAYNEFDELEKNIQHWYYTYQTIHKKISSSVYKGLALKMSTTSMKMRLLN